MELYCASNFEIGLFGSLFFVGCAFCGIPMNYFECYGRKFMLIIGSATNIVLSFVLYFGNNIYIRYIALLIYGITWAKILYSYIYVSEIGPNKSRIYCCAVLNFTEVVSIIPASLYFMFISNEWQYFYFVSILISVITFPFVFYIPESPKFLYETKRYDELRITIKNISIANWVIMDEHYIFENSILAENPDDKVLHIKNKNQQVYIENSSNDSENKFSIIHYFKNPIIATNLIVLWILSIVSLFNYYMICFYIKYIGGNMYINMILMTISENIAYLTGGLIQSYIGTK